MVSNLVGARIRAVRAKRKLTQQQLATLAGIPRATLATVERDDANPTLAVVYRIATALKMRVDDLLEPEREPVQVIRGGEMRLVQSRDGHYRAVTVSPANAFHLVQQTFILDGGAAYPGKPHPPGSEEYLHILKGAVVLEVAGRLVRLEAGDSARFQGNVPHTYENPGSAEAVGVVTILEQGGRRGGGE